MEIWKDIPGYEGRYQVSDLGRVRSLDRIKHISQDRWGGASSRFVPGRLVTISVDDRGRCFVALRTDVRTRRHSVHSLVAASFIGPRPQGLLVLHGDGNTANNMPANLRYGTHCDNVADARKHGTISQGETQWLAKLTAEAVRTIRASPLKGIQLAQMFKVTPAAISAIRKRKNWKHV